MKKDDLAVSSFFCILMTPVLYSKTLDGCAPLFLACRNGSAEVAEYLLSRCSAPIEQKGLFEVGSSCGSSAPIV